MEMHEVHFFFFSFFPGFDFVLILHKLVVLFAVLLINPKAFTPGF